MVYGSLEEYPGEREMACDGLENCGCWKCEEEDAKREAIDSAEEFEEGEAL